MDRWSGRVALVTGASVGIGAAICRELVKHGMTVVGCARNDKQIEDIAKELKDCPGSLTAIRCDLTQPDQIEAMFRTIKERFGGVDACINNAGLNFVGSLLDGDLGKWRNVIEVNVMALVHCTQLAVRSMKERDVAEGQVINIGSMSGHRVLPFGDVHFYTATKFAVTALTEGLRQELAAQEHNKIRVAQVSPGMVTTEFSARMHNEPSRKPAGLKAKDVADAVIYVMSAAPEVQVHDVLMRATFQTY